MRTLYLLRHAKARREPRTDDRDRSLSRRGLRQGSVLAAHLAKQERPPERVLCSPSRRTRETLELVRPALSEKTELSFLDGLYLASAESLLHFVLETDDAVRSLMLVGHNDGIHQFALALCERDQLPRLVGFPTGALAILEFDIADWSHIRPAGGRLIAAIDPDAELEEA